MERQKLTQCRLKEALDYCPDTGFFTWKIKASRNTVVGEIAGYLAKDGYVQIRLDKTCHYAHRLAWLYVYGSFPVMCVDHIDGHRYNNSLKNLREASPAENNQNLSGIGNGVCGLLGVKFANTKSIRFDARIRHKNKRIHLGSFDTAEEAHQAYLDAKKILHTFNPVPRP